MRTLLSVSHSEAEAAVTAIKQRLLSEKKTASIAVADVHGDVIAFLRVDGASPTTVAVALNKAWTSARERVQTIDIGRGVRDPARGYDVAYFGDPRYVGWGGGVPVTAEGHVVGAVAVSGLSEDEDIRLARLGVDAIASVLHKL